MPVNKGLSALSRGPHRATRYSALVRAPGIYVGNLALRVKDSLVVPFRSRRVFELQLTTRTKNEDQSKVPTRVTTGIPVAFAYDEPETARLWLDWADLFALVLGRTVIMPGIIVQRGKP